MLDKRLKVAASYVRKNINCVDVGTDHAYLPVYLYENNITKNIIASDINDKPLEAARKTIEDKNLTGKIDVIKSNGLENIEYQKAQDIIICGMGGELIMNIMLSSKYTKDKDKRFILQPMTNISHLRKELYKSGYEILSETPVVDKYHIYTVMHVQYTGNIENISTLFSIIGQIPKNKCTESKKYIAHQLKRQNQIAQGLRNSKDRKQDAIECEKLASELEKLLEEM